MVRIEEDGHIHTEKGKKTPFEDKLVPNQYDVGMDNNDYTPVSFEQIQKYFNLI